MTTITYIEFNGSSHSIDATNGISVMQNAINNSIPGIVGDCGGALSCATCHAYVDPPWSDRIPTAESAEKDMIDCVMHQEPTSRFTCQIVVSDTLEGLVVRLPKSQF